MLTTKESAASPSSSRATADSEDEAASDGGGEMEAAPDGERAGDEVGERPSPTTVESAEDLRAEYGVRLGFTQPIKGNIARDSVKIHTCPMPPPLMTTLRWRGEGERGPTPPKRSPT